METAQTRIWFRKEWKVKILSRGTIFYGFVTGRYVLQIAGVSRNGRSKWSEYAAYVGRIRTKS